MNIQEAPSQEGVAHRDSCPLARPWLYDLDEHPLECICIDLKYEDWEPWEDATWD